MKLLLENWKNFVDEGFGGEPPMNPAEMKEHEISHAAESLARQLEKEHGAAAAIKLLAYAMDTIQPGLYQPSDAERERFIQDPEDQRPEDLSGHVSFGSK